MKNKAFTLVELLGVIVLLGILSIVIIPKIGDSLENSKETALLTQEEQIKKAAYDFLIEHTELLDESDTITLKLGTLKQGGYLPIKLINPKTRKPLSNESTITIIKNENKYEMTLNLIDLENATENIDNNSPILVLNGNYIEYVEVNEEYTELGAKAIDSTGEEIDEENISIQVLYNGEETTLTTTELKTYSVVYAVTDNSGNTTSATRTVIVRDSKAPTIIIPKDTSIHVSEIASFNNQRGVIIADNYDANPTLTIDSTLANIPRTYVITYTVTDSSGNQTTERRVINVNNDIYESHEIAYQINGKTTPSSTNTPTMESPVTYYGLGQNNQIKVTTTGKNMFDEESILGTIEDAQYVDGHYVFNVNKAYLKYKDFIPGISFKENTQYTITVTGYSIGKNENTNNGETNFRIVFKYTDGTEQALWLKNKTEQTVTRTSTEGKTIEKIYMNYGYPGTVYVSHMQIEEGTSQTDFEPYKGRTTTIDMTGHDPLMCANDTCDYIDYENGVIARYVKKYAFTGNETISTWTQQNTETTKGIVWLNSTILGSYPDDFKIQNTMGFCTHFPLGDSAYVVNDRLRYGPKGTTNPPYISFRIPIDINMNTWLTEQYNAGTPLIAYYVLINPEYEPIILPSISKYYDDYHIIAHDEYSAVEVTY